MRIVTALALGAAVLCPACGGAKATDLYDGKGGAARAPDTGTPGAASDGKDTAPTKADATAPARDASATPDAAIVDAAPRDTGPPHTPTSVACGAQRCTIPAQDCCRTRTFANELAYACVIKGACFGFESLAVPCDDGADCATLGSPGQVCCYSATSNGVTDVRCRPQAECQKPSRGNLCDPAVPLATACPNASGPNPACARGAVASFDFPVCVP